MVLWQRLSTSRSCPSLHLLHPVASPFSLHCRQAGTSSKDYYGVLGIKPNATAKEVKVAFYKKSKEYHPDTNPDNADESARKFHQVTEAYEVLGSDEKRKLYDMNRKRTFEEMKHHSSPYVRPTVHRHNVQYEDLGLNYKQFELFQKTARQRRQTAQAQNDQRTKEFFDKFGGRPIYKNEYDEMFEEFLRSTGNKGKSEAELLKEIEMEKRQHAAKYPVPEFERIIETKRRQEKMENVKLLLGLIGGCILGGVTLYATSVR